jgi:Rhomboid family
MHLLLNMIFLYMAGRYIEQMWGHVRYSVIYLAGLLGGCCLSVSHFAGLSAGASGAVCGLLGAEAVWFLLNRRYLPRSLLHQARFSLISSAVLLVFISSFKDVSGWGHFGGAVAGALAALLLHLHRFGPAGWRWLAVAGFVPLTWLGYYAIDRARAADPKWHEIEDQQFVDHYHSPVRDAMSKASIVYQKEVLPLLQKHPTRRNDAQVESVLSIAAQQQRELNALVQRLDHAGPYRSPEAEDARQISREYVLARADLFAGAEHVLRLGDKQTWHDKQALAQQEQRVIELHDKWRGLFTREPAAR